MNDFRYIWVVGLMATATIILLPIILLTQPNESPADDPWQNVPEERIHTDHTGLLDGPFTTGQDVTRACLECHPDAAQQVMATSHWTWKSQPVIVDGHPEPVEVGKANSLNNFCIGVQSNWAGCTRCHAGYGWEDAEFDFADGNSVDCLVCHDQSGAYVKSTAGNPAEGVDLMVAAESVGTPTRQNCGGCHFNGGGGNGVKHGDLDESLYFPSESVDVHMGRHDFLCVDCHKTEDHAISGRSISLAPDDSNQVYCTDCHSTALHEDDRLNKHIDTVACQTCHIPAGAVKDPTKISWDWSTAGQDRPEDPHEYLKIKGDFIYESNFRPSYIWFDGTADRYLYGDLLDPSGVTPINQPHGDIASPDAKIWPFKIHVAKQPYDTIFNYLLQPHTTGETGYWTTFDWDQSLRIGSEAAGLDYSGSYDFAETTMFWPLSHMVSPAEQALQCTDCHGENGRLDWQALGYLGDPMVWGGRDLFTEDQ